MMLDVDFSELREGVQRYAPIGALVGLILFVELAFVMIGWVVHQVLPVAAAADDGGRDQYRGFGFGAVHQLYFSVSARGRYFAGGDDRAIVLTLRDRKRGKTQNIDAQHARLPKLDYVTAKLGEGAKVPTHAEDAPVMQVALSHFLVVAGLLLVIGIFGIFMNRKNIIIIMMSIELILLAANINLVAFSGALHDLVGQVFTMFVLTVAAAEAAIGLAIVVIYFRNRGSIEVEDVTLMKG